MKNTISILLALVLCLSLCACGISTKEATCAHNYYLSDYSDATSSSNGYRKFTCSNCGHTYQEVLPANEELSSSNTNANETKDVDLTHTRSVNLFDLPVYSDKNVVTGSGVLSLVYCSELTDVDGWKHTNCYQICGSSGITEKWVRYELNSKYTTIVGNLYYFTRDGGGAGWLEFYDGEDFIAATPKIDENTSSTEFKIDITGVEYLTVHFRATKAGTWMIADDIMLTK